MKRGRNGAFRGPKLPRELMDQIDGPGSHSSGSSGPRRGSAFPPRHHSERQGERAHQQRGRAHGGAHAQGRPSNRPRPSRPNDDDSDDGDDIEDSDSDGGAASTPADVFAALKRAKEAKAGGKAASQTEPKLAKEDRKQKGGQSREKPAERRKARTKDEDDIDAEAKAELAIYDAEISALEEKLGKDKKLSRELDEDGMADLLDGVGASKKGREQREKDAIRKLKGRGRVVRLKPGTDVLESDESGDSDDSDDDPFDLDGLGECSDDDESEEEASGSEAELDGSGDDDGDFDADSDDFDDDDDFDDSDSGEPDEPPAKRVKENPYRPPAAPSELTEAEPTRRRFDDDTGLDTEAQRRLERQVQGQINRISESSLVGIARTVGDLYKSHSRHAVSSAVTKILLGAIDSAATLTDSFLILHAGFAVAMVRVGGVEFGAMMVEKTVCAIRDGLKTDGRDKRALNLVSVLCYLFVFGVVGPAVVFDYIKLFLSDLSETNTEFLLRMIRSCGPELRHDDPAALKDIVILLQSQIAQHGMEGLSVRTRFMIETIDDLKNNKLKQARVATVAAEQVGRLKKLLAGLGKQPEPLQIGLADLEGAEKKGKWWVVGASWRGNMADQKTDSKPDSKPDSDMVDKDGDRDDDVDVDDLARTVGMNTDVRRAIFTTIVTSPSPADCLVRLLKLELTKQQQLQIPRVVVQAALAEQLHNPFYAHVARSLCAAEHRFKKAFQFVMWDYWKRVGVVGARNNGGDDSEDDDDGDGDSSTGLTLGQIVNLGKLYAHLVATETQPLGLVLKPVLETTVSGGNVPILLHPPKQAKSFLQLFFFALFVDASSSHRWTPPARKAKKKRGEDSDDSDWDGPGPVSSRDLPFADLPGAQKGPSRRTEKPAEVIAKLVRNVVRSHPDAAEPLRFFGRKHVRVKPDGTGGVAGLASKKSELNKAVAGWAAMDGALRVRAE